ncbi:MAG: hypothetical protein QXG84_06480 [Ignisphaera sp.]
MSIEIRSKFSQLYAQSVKLFRDSDGRYTLKYWYVYRVCSKIKR